MDTKQYQKESGATDERSYETIIGRMTQPQNARLIHYLLGVGTEAGELQDMLKKHLIYGKEFDRVNLIEECGDVLWYMVRALDTIGSSLDEAMERNNRKLKLRFGDKFSEHAAMNRDLYAERRALTGPDWECNRCKSMIPDDEQSCYCCGKTRR